MANTARGEVELKVGKETFVLCADLERIVAWQDDIGIEDLFEIYTKVVPDVGKNGRLRKGPSASVVLSGVKHLCISDNSSKLSTVLHLRHLPLVAEALITALAHAFEEDEEGKA